MQGRESPVKASKYFVVVETPVPKFYDGFLSQPLKWVKKKGMKALNFKNSVLMRKFITHVQFEKKLQKWFLYTILQQIMFFRPIRHSTLLVLIGQSELFTWCSVTKTFDILPKIIIEYQIQA